MSNLQRTDTKQGEKKKQMTKKKSQKVITTRVKRSEAEKKPHRKRSRFYSLAHIKDAKKPAQSA